MHKVKAITSFYYVAETRDALGKRYIVICLFCENQQNICTLL